MPQATPVFVYLSSTLRVAAYAEGGFVVEHRLSSPGLSGWYHVNDDEMPTDAEIGEALLTAAESLTSAAKRLLCSVE